MMIKMMMMIMIIIIMMMMMMMMMKGTVIKMTLTTVFIVTKYTVTQ